MNSALGLAARGEVLVATLSGEVDISNVAEIAEEIEAALGNVYAGLCLDLSETRYLDSAGVRMVFELRARLHAHRQVLAAAVPEDAPVRRLLEVTNLAAAIGVHASVDDCLSWIEASAREPF